MKFSDKIAATGGRSHGFDYLRLFLAVMVMVWHSIVTSYGPDAQDSVQLGPFRPIFAFIVPAFFALSGFLVAGSLERNTSLKTFAGLRVIRIMPALSVEIILSALLIGPLFTQYLLRDYFTDPVFYRYFLNVLGFIQYKLPGVFLHNPNPETVNGQLWTIPFELYCYAAIIALAIVGITKRPALMAVAIAALTLAALFHYFRKYGWTLERRPSNVPGSVLVLCFLTGVYFYLIRNRLVWRTDLLWMSIAASAICLSLPPAGDFLSFIPISYATCALGLTHPKKHPVLQGADYSYGIFLYGYAIQQATVAAIPAAIGNWAVNLAVALPITVAIAALSWHIVEKPALSLRRFL